MDARDQELKKELAATIQARKDLGEEYESALVDSFMEKIDQRLDAHVERRVRRELAQHQTSFARAGRPGPAGPRPGPPHGGGARFAARYGLAGFSLVFAIPLSAIGGEKGGLAGLLVTWVGIVGVNTAQSVGAFVSERGSRRSRPKDDDAWED